MEKTAKLQSKAPQKPIRIAQVIGKWKGGGVEAVVMNYYRHIDRSKIQFDFIINEDSANIPTKEIKELGGKIIFVPPYQKLPKYIKTLRQIFKDNKYRIVHSHINTLSVFPLYAAKKAGVKVRIAHSHSTSNPHEPIRNLIKGILKPLSKRYATDYFACSEYAGRWLFGNKAFNEGKVTIIHNAIDLDKFKFSAKARKEVRKELNIPDSAFVIGHIGRFVKQKNHTFLIDVFNEVHKEKPNSVLILVGEGPLMPKIKEKVEKLSLTDSVKFLGQRNDIYRLYSAMDVFCLPSLYEGLPVVGVEAQASGLPCILSKNVSNDVKISKEVTFISLDSDINIWKNKNEKSTINRLHSIQLATDYDIKLQFVKIENFYLNQFYGSNLELFGLPGSGKSTLSKMIKQKNKTIVNMNEKYLYGYRIQRNFKKYFYMFLFNLKYRQESKKVKSVLDNFIFNTKRVKEKMKIYLYSTLFIIKDKKEDNFLLEEGLAQVLWAFCYNSKNGIENIENFVIGLKEYFNKNIQYCDVDIDTIMNRLKCRNNFGGSELEHDIKKDGSKIIFAKKIEEKIVQYLKFNTDIEVIK